MSLVTCQISVSLDGYAAGPNQSLENPLGEGGMGLHQWAFATDAWRGRHGGEGGERSADSEVIAEGVADVGAYVMGRRMFGGGEGPWDPAWRGWWDEDPPFHAPVFVVTHHERAPLEMEGGTTFHFVTDGVAAAVDRARAAAGERKVSVAGGAATVQQVLAAGLLDELHLHIVPILLGGGERLLDHAGDPQLEIVKTVGSPTVTHVKYRVIR